MSEEGTCEINPTLVKERTGVPFERHVELCSLAREVAELVRKKSEQHEQRTLRAYVNLMLNW